MLTVVAVVLTANGIMAWRIQSRLQAKIDAIRAAGDPATIVDLEPAPISADQNAAEFLAQIKPQLKLFDRESIRFYDSPLGKQFGETEGHGEPPTDKQLELIRSVVDRYPAIDAGLKAAAECPRYASRLDYSLNYDQFLEALLANAWPLRSATFFTKWRMLVLAANRQHDEAVDRGIDMLQIARHYEEEPGLVSFLAAIGMQEHTMRAIADALVGGPVSRETHVALDQELASLDDPQRLVRAFKRERPIGIGSIANVEKHFQSYAIGKLVSWSASQHYLGAIDLVNDQLLIADRPWSETHRFDGKRNGETGLWNIKEPRSGYGVMADLLLPSLSATYDAHARNLAMIRALRILNAITEYRDAHTHEASSLSDLALPPEATIDPFSGEPLKLKRTDHGWVIYTVMQNGVDDGGDFRDQKDWGLAPRKKRAE